MALPLPVSSLIDEFDVGPLTLTRRGIPTLNVYGEYTAAAAVNVILSPVAVHVVTGKNRLNLPEAIRESETIEVYTKVRVYSGNDSQASDVLTYQGRTWVCVQTVDFDSNGGVFISFWTIQDTN